MRMLSLIFMVMAAQYGFGQRLVVRIENIKDDRGEIGVAIYDNDKDFLKKEKSGRFVPAKKGMVEVVFENLPAGGYALSVMHDSNKNGQLDTNLLGIPKEGFGFSNNAMGTFGPPTFEKAKINHQAGVVVIRMRY